MKNPYENDKPNKPFLCRIGLHDWQIIQRELHVRYVNKVCIKCGKIHAGLDKYNQQVDKEIEIMNQRNKKAAKIYEQHREKPQT